MDIRLPLLTFANVYSLHGNDYLLPLLLFLLLPFVHFVSFRLVHFVRSLGRSICITFVFKPIPEIEWPISISNRQVENCFTGCDPNRVNCYLAAHLTTNKIKTKFEWWESTIVIVTSVPVCDFIEIIFCYIHNDHCSTLKYTRRYWENDCWIDRWTTINVAI